ncbi:hypothetical protein INR49_008623 [Caranx melampygus]|nr:hypothetical protein INR49_008623 [Caranx melampygus]
MRALRQEGTKERNKEGEGEYPSQHVFCSEQSLSDPGQSAGDRNSVGHEQEQEQEQELDSTQQEVVEEWTTHTSYDMGLEAERAALEKLATHSNTHQEQTVNPQEAEVEETRPEPESDTVPEAPEAPEPQPPTDLDLQTDTQDHKQESPVSSTPEPVPAQSQVSEDPQPRQKSTVTPPLRIPVQTHTHPHPQMKLTTHLPHRLSAKPTQVWVASAGDELPVDSFVFAEHSQCGVIPPELATCENSPFGSPLLSADETGVEDQRSGQSLGSGLEAEVQSAPGNVDHEHQPQQRQELEDGLSAMNREANTSHHPQEPQARETSTVRETDPAVPSEEEIPTFDEWKKQVMEVEKEKSQSLHTSASGSPHPVKKVQKNFKNNYASVECGAKILSANSEAKSTSAILMENMDLYMLNPCSNKIWFVIELCEPIQVKQLDIANFELFSSTPKDFLVSISDRYPTNKWVKLGTFHARDERIVQSFPLDEQLYAKYVKMFIKYIKVELLSHFGSEHFCPLSLIRVFGTSMVEEYEEIADSQYPSERLEYLDEDYDYPPGYQPSEDKASKNLLGSATNAILNMVNNIAANVLGGKPELEGGEETGGNTTAEGSEKSAESTEVKAKPAETPHHSAEPHSTESEHTVLQKDSNERLRSLRRRQMSTQTQTPPDAHTPVLTHTPPQVPVPAPTPPQEALPLTDRAPEPEVSVKGQNERKPLGEVDIAHTHLNTHIPAAHTPELNILLEPSRTSTIPPHSFTDTHSSLMRPTPTHEERLLPPIKDAALDPVLTPLQAVSIPETHQASSATPSFTISSPSQLLSSETASPAAAVAPVKEQPVQPLPTATRPDDFIPPPTELPAAVPPTDTHTDTVKSGADSGDSQKRNVPASQTHGEQADSLPVTGESHRVEEAADEELLSTNGNGNIHRTATDFYAELQNGGDYNSGAANGNGVVLNGERCTAPARRKAYRKQMEEMQRAFNKTIIKLQNTSRIAEEQVLQNQLENVTKLMLNLTAAVGQLQREVSDRQSYLVVSLVLCLSLGLLLCLQCFSSYDDMSLKRRVTCPLVRSKSFHLSSTEVGPDDLYIVEPLRFSPEKKKKRCKTKSLDKVETLKTSDPLASLTNGGVKCNGFHPCLPAPPPALAPPPPPLPLPAPPPPPLPLPNPPSAEEEPSLPACTSKELPSETSSCSSSTHSEESYTSRLPPPSPTFPSTGLCNGHSLSFPLQQPPTKSRQEKRSMKRRKSRQTELQFPHMPGGALLLSPACSSL